VKTFVLSLGASLGLMLANRGGASEAFGDSKDYCNDNFTTDQWWRIPIYLACSVGVLGQYRFRIDRYWSALIVQLVAYEVQYQVFHGMKEQYTSDHLDTATSNIAGAVGGVISACTVSWFVNTIHNFYSARLLQEDPSESSTLVNIVYRFMRFYVKLLSCLRINRKSEIQKLGMEEKLKGQHKELNDPLHPREHISLDKEDEDLFLETIVSAQDINIWSILMPAVYQLVPGSVIARFWFHSIFPEEPQNMAVPITSQESVFSNLMVISASLALGLIFGFSLVQSYNYIYGRIYECCHKEDDDLIAKRKHQSTMMEGMFTAQQSPDDDPASFSFPSENYNEPE